MPDNKILGTSSVSPIKVRSDLQNNDAPRFSPTELKVLIEEGKLTDEDIALLHPADRAVVNKLRTSSAMDIPAMGLGIRDLFKGTGDAFMRGFKRGFAKPAPYPPNVSTQEGSADLMDRVLGTSRQGAPTPLKYHESAPPEMRKSVDTLKSKVARRKPN